MNNSEERFKEKVEKILKTHPSIGKDEWEMIAYVLFLHIEHVQEYLTSK